MELAHTACSELDSAGSGTPLVMNRNYLLLGLKCCFNLINYRILVGASVFSVSSMCGQALKMSESPVRRAVRYRAGFWSEGGANMYLM